MKFSLKSIAAAVVMAVAVSGAHAAINNGANDGQGELFFSAFDGVSSYSYDLNISIVAFEASKDAAGLLNLSYGSDFTSSFSSWMSTANASTVEWNILATDTAGARRILSTVGAAVLLGPVDAPPVMFDSGHLSTGKPQRNGESAHAAEEIEGGEGL